MGRKQKFSLNLQFAVQGAYSTLETLGLESAKGKSVFPQGNKKGVFASNRAKAQWFKQEAETLLKSTATNLIADLDAESWDYLLKKTWMEFKYLRERGLPLRDEVLAYKEEFFNKMKARDLSVSFTGKTLLDLLSFKLEAGEGEVKDTFSFVSKDVSTKASAEASDEVLPYLEGKTSETSSSSVEDKGSHKDELEVLPPLLEEEQSQAESAGKGFGDRNFTKGKLVNYVRECYHVSDANTTWYSDWITREDVSLLLIVDAASRAILVGACYKGPPSSEQFLKVLMDLFAFYGKPSKIHTDQGGAYMGQIVADYLQEQGVLHSFGVGKSTAFANQAMESINSVLTRYLEIEKTNRGGVKSFNSRSLADKTWLVKAAISHWNDVPLNKLDKASPMELYHYLQKQAVKLNIEAKEGTELAARAALWKDIGKSQIMIQKRLTALTKLGVDKASEFEALTSQFEFSPGLPTSMFREILGVLRNFLSELSYEQKTIQRMLEVQSDIATRRFDEERSARIESQKEAAKAYALQEAVFQKLTETQEQLQKMLAEQAEEKRKKEERKAALAARKRKPLRDAFDFEDFKLALSLVNTQSELANARLRISLVILACFGIRIGQLQSFTIRNLRELYEGDGTKVEAIKSRHRQFLDLPKALPVKQWLNEVEDDILLVISSGMDDELLNPTSREHQNRQINKVLKQVALLRNKTYNSHSFRVGIITKVTKEKGIEVARRVANHVSIATTQHYVRTTLDKREMRNLLRDVIPGPNKAKDTQEEEETEFE